MFHQLLPACLRENNNKYRSTDTTRHRHQQLKEGRKAININLLARVQKQLFYHLFMTRC